MTNLNGSELFSEYLKKKAANAPETAMVILKEQVRRKINDLMNTLVHSEEFQNSEVATTVLPYDVGNVIFGKGWKTMSNAARAGWVSFIISCIDDFTVKDVAYEYTLVTRTGRKSVFYIATDLGFIISALDVEGMKEWLISNPDRKANLIDHLSKYPGNISDADMIELQEWIESFKGKTDEANPEEIETASEENVA